MTPTLRRTLSGLLILGFAVWVTGYVSRHSDDFSILGTLSVNSLLPLYAAFALVIVANAAFIVTSLRALGRDLSIREAISLSGASSFGNLFLPMHGGMGIRGVYLRHCHGLSITDFGVTLGVFYLTQIGSSAVLGLVGLGLQVWEGRAPSYPLSGFFLIFAISCGVATLIPVRVSRGAGRLGFLSDALAAWSRLRRQEHLLGVWGSSVLLAIATVWQSRAAFSAVAVPLSWGDACLYAGVKNLAALASLTPGGIGVVEVALIAAGQVLDYGTSKALLAQLLVRSVSFSALLIMGPLAMLHLRRRISSRSQVRNREATI